MKKIDAHAHIFERIASFGKCGELRPIGNGVCRWANGDEMAIIPKGYGDKEFMAETLLKIMSKKQFSCREASTDFRMNMLWKQRKNIRIVLRLL